MYSVPKSIPSMAAEAVEANKQRRAQVWNGDTLRRPGGSIVWLKLGYSGHLLYEIPRTRMRFRIGRCAMDAKEESYLLVGLIEFGGNMSSGLKHTAYPRYVPLGGPFPRCGCLKQRYGTRPKRTLGMQLSR